MQTRLRASDAMRELLVKDVEKMPPGTARDNRIEQLRWLVSEPSSDADFPRQYGAARLFTAREQSSPDEQLIKP